MQKILTSAFTLLFAIKVFAQHEPIQPFEELGIKVEVLTLSKGKYQESFPNDTILRFGSVLFDRTTGEVVSVVVEDTLYGEYNLKPEVASRWLSTDPLAGKNPHWSPYTAFNNNPVIYIDPDGKDAIISIKPGVNGANGTITVTIVFNAKTGTLTNDVMQQASASFQSTWGNGLVKDNKNGTYTGKAFTDVAIDGQNYDVSYNLVLRESDNAPAEGQNALVLLPNGEKDKTSHYGAGQMDYREGQDQGTTFGHEIAHVLGIGENLALTDKDGNPSISSYQSKRGVIVEDVVNSVQNAVQLAKGNGNSIVTLVTGRGTSNTNTLNLKDSNKKTVRSAQYQTIENRQ